ncbi:MAG TPA: hypothetical protein PLD93_04605, partial [Synergistaceae bacterium]|nr:hypothetical protein [Synergistaceae bacterium]
VSSNARLRQAEDFWNYIKGVWGGSCAGFTLASLGFYQGEWDVAAYGGSGGAYGIPHDLSENGIVEWINRLQFHQNYYRHWSDRSRSIYGVRDVVDSLLTGISRGYYMSIGGHAVLPYKIEDQGGGIYHIYIYNNWFNGNDGDYLVADYNGGTWTYWPLPGVRNYLRLDVGGDLIPSPEMREYYRKQGLAREGDLEEKISIVSSLMDFYLTDSQGRVSGYQGGSYVRGAEDCQMCYLESDTSKVLCRYELPSAAPFRLYLGETGTEDSEMDMMLFTGEGFFRYRETRGGGVGGAREISLSGTGEYGIQGGPASGGSDMEIVLNEYKDEIDKSYTLRGSGLKQGDSLKIWTSSETEDFELNAVNYGEVEEFDLELESRVDEETYSKTFDEKFRISQGEGIKVEVQYWKYLKTAKITVRVDKDLDGVYDSVYVIAGTTSAKEQEKAETLKEGIFNYPNPFSEETN